MASSSSSFPFPRLASDNYARWCVQMRTYLGGQDVWDAVEVGVDELLSSANTAKLQRQVRVRDQRALSIIQQSVDDSNFEKIATAMTAKSAWKLLQKAFKGVEKVQRVRLQTLRGDWEALRMTTGDSISDYCSRVRAIANQMSLNGETLEEVRIVEKILRSLEARFDPVVIALEEARDVSAMSVEELMGSLLAHEEKFSKRKKESLKQALQTKLQVTHDSDPQSAWGSQAGRGYSQGRGRSGFSRGRGRGSNRGRGANSNSSYQDGNASSNRGRRVESGGDSFNVAERFDDLKISGGRGGGAGQGRRGCVMGRGGGWCGEDVNGRNHFDDGGKFNELEVAEQDIPGGGGLNNGINFDAYEDIPVETNGTDIPAPVSTFADIDLGDALNENIRRCKYVKPTPIQRYAIPIAIAGRDLMACAQTGSGKTASFCFPIISGILKGQNRRISEQYGGRTAYPVALILSPTRELSCQIHDEAKKFAYQSGVKVVVVYGGAPMYQQLRDLEKGVDILVATPGRLVDMVEREIVSLNRISYLALDEADRMLDMGFEQQIRKIVQQMGMPPPGDRQTMLFSATFPSEIQRLASEFLKDYIFLSVGRVGSSTDLIVQKVDFVQDMAKRSHLKDLLIFQRANGAHGKRALTLVFVETKKGADELEGWLSRNGFPAATIHGNKVQMERERALKSFKTGTTPILVATDVAARGLDIPCVAHVINFDLPRDIDDYVHRIGRTGRAGKSGLATAFFNDKNSPIAKALVDLMEEAKQEVPSWLQEYAERSSFSGSSSGRRQRYHGGSNFGGHDFGHSPTSSYDYPYQSSSHYINDDPPVAGYSAASYSAPAVAGSYVSYPQGPGYDYASVVATGWD